MENTLTLQEAIQEGYSAFIYANDGWQAIKMLNEYQLDDDIDWTRDDIYLVQKEGQNPAGLSAEEIAEMLAENIQCSHSDETGDDTDDVYDAIKRLDFSDVSEKINEALAGIFYYRQTNIHLIKER